MVLNDLKRVLFHPNLSNCMKEFALNVNKGDILSVRAGTSDKTIKTVPS